jgi:hypothetical protein
MLQSLLSSNDQLDFDFDINASGQIQPHQHIDCFGVRVENIDQTIVGPDLIVLV